MEKTLWQAQEYDTDCESWQDMEHEGSQGYSRSEVESEAKYQANKCAYKVRTRVVKV